MNDTLHLPRFRDARSLVPAPVIGSATTSLSATVSGIPTNGTPAYLTLGYLVGGVWKVVNYTYNPTLPAMTSPAPGTTLTGSSVTFTWSAGAGPTEHQLRMGTAGAGSSNAYLGSATTALSAMVSGLPTNGQPVYVTLGYKVNEVWHAVNYTYTAQ